MRARSQLSCSKFPINLATFASWLPAAEEVWRKEGVEERERRLAFDYSYSCVNRRRVGEMFFISDGDGDVDVDVDRAKGENV